MLIVRAEIWPGGDGRCRFPIGELIAANEGRLTEMSAYSGCVIQAPAPDIGVMEWSKEFLEVEHHRRSGVWPLVAAILKTVLEEQGDHP